MTSTIIILPLIILAIMLVSGAIISLVTHIYVEKVEFSNSEAIVLVMDDETNPPTHDLKAEITVFPLEAPNRDIVYTDYDKSLLKISDDGIVTPLFYGETYVTVQSVENKAATATRKIIVTANHVHALKLNEYQKDWYEGDTAQFSVSVYPQEAENKSVTWSSSDADILQIASSGMATAKGNGKVTITATSKDTPEVTASAEVVCHAKIRGLDFDDNLLQTSLTEVQFPTVAVSPDPCDATVKYSVDNARIAAVDELTGKLTFKTPGKVTVTVTGTDFKGNSVTGQKTIVSTMGYFVGPLFDNKEVNFADCSVGAALPLNFAPKLEGTYKLIGEIEYTFDSPFESGKGQTGLIAYNESEKVFKLTDNFPEFDNYVNIIVHATIYDSKDDALVNVFNAAGYINTANKKIVLHSNLYGPEELGGGDATPDILTINSTDSGALGKTLIYGNGYQVNLQAKNKALCDELKDKENTGTGGITFGTLYNVTLKGTNTTGEVGCKTHKILMSMNGAYYSDLQCYSKMNPASTKMFFKNTVLRYVANAAVQLYMGSNPYNLYFENVVAVECMRVVSLETTQISNFNLKGFFDILDYNNAADLQNKYNSINGGWLYAMSLTESAIKEAAPNHIEWFGSNGNDYSKSNYKYYVNIGVIQQGSDDIFKERHWDEKENKYSEAVTSEQVRFSNIQLIQGLATAHIPNALNSADGGASDYKSRNTDLLFTDTRDIRLLCQFRTINGTKLEKNTEHIQWHMDKVHRDMSLIKNRTEDHITALKESLKNITWPDGTGTDGDGNVKAVAAAMNSLLSQAIVPGKREYAVV